MSDEKRIEEMANDIASICPDLVDSGCMGHDCVVCLTRKLEKLGYRKQSEVAREILREIDSTLIPLNAIVHNGESVKWDALPAVLIRCSDWEELKKKYTGGE